MGAPPGEATSPALMADLVGYLRRHLAPTHVRRLGRALWLARWVEWLHRADADCPRGLTRHLKALTAALDAHRRQEELVLFPRLEAAGAASVAPLIEQMHDEHHQIAEQLTWLAVLTRDFSAPENAGCAWRALCRTCRRLDRELREQIRLERDVLYPCFDALAAAGSRPNLVLVETA